MTRRVAVTGIGVIAAPGSTRAAFWESLSNGRSVRYDHIEIVPAVGAPLTFRPVAGSGETIVPAGTPVAAAAAVAAR